MDVDFGVCALEYDEDSACVVMVGVGDYDLVHVLRLDSYFFELGPDGVCPVSYAWVYDCCFFATYGVYVAAESFSEDEVDVFECGVVLL